MSYTTYDLSESLERAGIAREAVLTVIAAWGDSPEGYGSWEGGFLLALRDGRTAYLTGWADTSGWGCQDGAQVYYPHSTPAREALPGPYGDELAGARRWDEIPADLNLFLADGTVRW